MGVGVAVVHFLVILKMGVQIQFLQLAHSHVSMLVDLPVNKNRNSEVGCVWNHKNTLVSQEYRIGFVDCRHANLQTSYHTLCATGYWKKLDGTRKLILLFIVWWIYPVDLL